jgi:hypothetical protein
MLSSLFCQNQFGGLALQYTQRCVAQVNRMANAKFSTRIKISLVALAATYIAAGVSVGFRFWDVQIFLLFLFWSVPFFAVGWILTGLPVIAAGNRVLKAPVILVVLAGAAGGFLVLLLLPLVEWVRYFVRPTPGITRTISLPWSYLKGWPAFCAALGACGTMLYRWLFSRAVNHPLEQAGDAMKNVSLAE